MYPPCTLREKSVGQWLVLTPTLANGALFICSFIGLSIDGGGTLRPGLKLIEDISLLTFPGSLLIPGWVLTRHPAGGFALAMVAGATFVTALLLVLRHVPHERRTLIGLASYVAVSVVSVGFALTVARLS